MAKVTITIEDKGNKTVSFLTEIEGEELASSPATPAMAMGMAARAMFENDMLSEAAAVALSSIANGIQPLGPIREYFSREEEP